MQLYSLSSTVETLRRADLEEERNPYGMGEAALAEASGRRSLSSLMCSSGLWVTVLVGPGPAAAAVWLQVKQGNRAPAASLSGRGSPHQDAVLRSAR